MNVIVDYWYEWTGNGKLITIQTTESTHLWMGWCTIDPRLFYSWKWIRGTNRKCDWVYILPELAWIEQNEPGDAYFHSFTKTPWYQGAKYYYVFSSEPEWRPDMLHGPIFYEVKPYSYALADPEPTDGYIDIPLTAAIIDPPNRYAHWAASTWHCLVPQSGCLTMWRLQSGTFTRLDQAHEPQNVATAIAAADSRLASDGSTIHIAYYCRSAASGATRVRYATFDTSSGLWASDAPAISPPLAISAPYFCSLSLSSADVPHLLYTINQSGFMRAAYTHKESGAWSSPEVPLLQSYRGQTAAALDHDSSDTLHYLFVSYSNLWGYRVRPQSGPWGVASYPSSDRENANTHTITCGPDGPAVVLKKYNALSHGFAVASPPTPLAELTYTTAPYDGRIVTAGATSSPRILVYRNAYTDLRTRRAEPPAAFGASQPLTSWGAVTLTTTPTNTDVFAVLCRLGGQGAPRFQAFRFPST